MKNTHQITPGKGKTLPKSIGKNKSKRVLEASPLRKYVIYRDPHQWDDDIATGGSEN
ncbi:hypothetical protein [Spirosoma jeollabukense]